MAFENLELWWITGAQLLYGGETVKIVDGHSKEMVAGLNESGIIPIKVVYKGTANSDKEVAAIMKAANNDEKCVGLITWMHTFSPAKMWIHGLQQLNKPMLHFHTQYNQEIPWDTMDMDFMNLKSSATSAPVSASLARSLPAIGRIRRYRSTSPSGRALPLLWLMPRICLSSVSAIR